MVLKFLLDTKGSSVSASIMLKNSYTEVEGEEHTDYLYVTKMWVIFVRVTPYYDSEYVIRKMAGKKSIPDITY